MTLTPHASFRLSSEGRKLLNKLAEHYGLTQTKVLEWMIREQARSAGLAKKR